MLQPQARKRQQFKVDQPGSEESDDYDLRRAHSDAVVPFFRSPFPPRRLSENGQALPSHSRSGSLSKLKMKGGRLLESEDSSPEVSKAREMEWMDLLLEVSMTTAFANLADNTAVHSGKTKSYISFSILVWWIWASQTAYNMRYRTFDWFHRFCSFLQFLTFSTMAAFTSDITSFLTSGSSTYGNGYVGREDTQKGPKINARGISLVVGFSRLLMLAQYGVLLVHVYANGHNRGPLLLFFVLLFTAPLYFIAFFLLGDDNDDTSPLSPGMSSAKMVLWYFAIAIETVAHFIATRLPGSVPYPKEEIARRSSTVLVIMLGVGLDKITDQFQYIVGQIGFDIRTVWASVSIAIVLFGFLILYFNSGRRMQEDEGRKLVYFLLHLPLISLANITLRGVAALLSFMNLTNVTSRINASLPHGFTCPGHLSGLHHMHPNHQHSSPMLGSGSLSFMSGLLLLAGIGTDEYMSNILAMCGEFVEKYPVLNYTLSNAGNHVQDALSLIDADGLEKVYRWNLGLTGGMLQVSLAALADVFEVFNAGDDASFSFADKMVAYLNSSEPSISAYTELISMYEVNRLRVALWFPATAGMLLILLGVMTYVKQAPRDRWEWYSVLTRLIGGLSYCILSFLPVDSMGIGDTFEPAHEFHGTKEGYLKFYNETQHLGRSVRSKSYVWTLAVGGWIIPSFALFLILLNIGDAMLASAAKRAYSVSSEADIDTASESKPTKLL